ncbi:MAG: N-acetylglucosamine-6-phosphate deacetylase [Kiritimatiellae bacterium]|nr:N-acetylglucosamine-6-phosphate deacetylase [Kiritimatiellia bacterium]
MIKNGFIDLQVNGYKGVDFASPRLTLEQIHRATRELVKAGTAAYCPTLVTNSLEIYKRNLRLFARAMNGTELKGRILGIHIEGPFISPLEGARGAHAPNFIRRPGVGLLKRFQEWAEGRIVLITIAPETRGAAHLIKYCSRQGIRVSLGHHFAGNDALEKAVQAGAAACTHLGNGLPNMINRHQNPLWRQLACDNLYGMFITDGHHLPADFIKVALRAKTAERFIVVSDAVDLAGLPPGPYEFVGRKVTLAPSGRISFAGTPYLAGSSANMVQCMNHLASLKLLTEKELWQVGRDNPLKFLGKNPAVLNNMPKPKIQFKNNKFRVRQ